MLSRFATNSILLFWLRLCVFLTNICARMCLKVFAILQLSVFSLILTLVIFLLVVVLFIVSVTLFILSINEFTTKNIKYVCKHSTVFNICIHINKKQCLIRKINPYHYLQCFCMWKMFVDFSCSVNLNTFIANVNSSKSRK